MDIEVKRMSPAAVELLDQLSVVCKRFNVEYATASEKDRFFVEAVSLHEYQLKKAHEQGLKRSEVPPFLGLKRSERSHNSKGRVSPSGGILPFAILFPLCYTEEDHAA